MSRRQQLSTCWREGLARTTSSAFSKGCSPSPRTLLPQVRTQMSAYLMPPGCPDSGASGFCVSCQQLCLGKLLEPSCGRLQSMAEPVSSGMPTKARGRVLS